MPLTVRHNSLCTDRYTPRASKTCKSGSSGAPEDHKVRRMEDIGFRGARMVNYRIPGWTTTRLRDTIIPKKNLEFILKPYTRDRNLGTQIQATPNSVFTHGKMFQYVFVIAEEKEAIHQDIFQCIDEKSITKDYWVWDGSRENSL